MKIVIATAVYYPMINGVAVFSHHLALGLAARGHEVIVLTPSQTGHSFEKTENGIRVYYLKSTEIKLYPDQIHPVAPKKKIFGHELPRLFYKNGFRVSAFPARKVKKILARFRPDVVHIQVSDPIGLSVASYAKKHHIPIVTTEHNQPEVLTDPLGLPKIIKKPANALLSAYFRNRQSKSDYVTMPTAPAIAHLLKNKKLDIPVVAVSNGVDLSHFHPGSASAEIYARYHLPKDAPIVLYVGRVDPEKKVGIVLDAFLKILPEIPDAHLVIVGDGVDRLPLEKIAKDYDALNAVHFLGRVVPPDLYELYKIGSLFVTASEIETQGIVLIEAAATGLPLIAVNAGAVAEVCRDGQNGFLLSSGDIKGIASTMKKLLLNKKLRAKFSANSLKIAKTHDFERTLDQFEEIYRQVIKNKR